MQLEYERKLYKDGITIIAGVDEVGRGPLVGPVVASAVILPKNYKLEGLTDSKKLNEKKRNYLPSESSLGRPKRDHSLFGECRQCPPERFSLC